jgi:hypothetical protein
VDGLIIAAALTVCPCLNQAFVVQRGTPAAIESEALELNLESVADSRCPANARCVWEGDAAVTLSIVTKGEKPERVLVHTSGRFAQDARYRGYTVRLVALAPEPPGDGRVDQSAYRATVLVTR